MIGLKTSALPVVLVVRHLTTTSIGSYACELNRFSVRELLAQIFHIKLFGAVAGDNGSPGLDLKTETRHFSFLFLLFFFL